MTTATEFDLVIRNGQVVDGTGAPAFAADVAIKDGRIAAVGQVAGKGRQELDAQGLLVTPGFVDIHTHYDGQAIWDRQLTPGSWHGVTTVVMGNCGVGFAPVRPTDRDALIELMEGVEDIPGPCLVEGLQWNWESFGEYLDALDAHQRDTDICAQLPHGPLRVYVMGERALRLENATAEDIAQMREIAAEAMRAGALGFSTSRTISHKTAKGDPTPMLRAQEEELLGIAMGLADAGHGQLEFVSDWDQPSPAGEFAMMRRLVEKSGRSCVFSLNQRHGDRKDVWRELLALSDQAAADGLRIRPVTAPRPIGSLFGLSGTQNPFAATPTYRSIANLPLAERVARMRDPEVRRRILSEDPYKDSTFPLFERMGFEKMYEHMFLLGDPPNYEPPRESSIANIARREGRSGSEVAYDMLLEDGGHSFLYATFTGFHDYVCEPTREMLNHPNAMIGLGDGGAHVGFITDACFPTYLLTHWGRDRASGRQPVEELVRRYTSDPAFTVGLLDRGVIKPGMKADVNIIDFDRLALGKPYVVDDLPAGGKRLLQKASGYKATILSGEITYLDGESTGATPGRLVRGPQNTPA
ncbi:amidohydrolase family protein [Hydrogenophaga sp.]|uniref:N-acyl-D-amino-acid deacylase family protein n=1 Tax=Hydrogenophaga sp. TaxID=1904254 RepID=UPI002625CFE3|nr:amidohydrolase family protein [Hydrogenophaga sp.]MCW5654344.1 amidohydrolase family protein [Hydrogenophaga sp.]